MIQKWFNINHSEMKRIIIDKKINKKIIKKKENKKIIHDEYGDKVKENIDYKKDKPPHW